MTDDPPALVALDWGTSSLRAFLMSASGRVLDTRASAHGIQHLPEPGVPGFEAAFAAICGDWLAASRVPVVAGGMVGSAQGWAEVPYLPCPAALTDLPGAATRVASSGGQEVLIAPGLVFEPEGGTPDVMRGEEIQIAGPSPAIPTGSRRRRWCCPAPIRNGPRSRTASSPALPPT